MRAIGDAHWDDNIRVVAVTGDGGAFCSARDSEDGHEAVQAVVEDRTPEFRGG